MRPCFAQQPAKVYRIPFHSAPNGLILLDVKIDGKARVMMLETGANVSFFARQHSIGIELEPGYIFNVPVWDLDKQLGERAFQLRREVGRFDGMLGQNFLRYFRTVKIDYENQVIELEAKR